MSPLEPMAQQLDWFTDNLIYNLSFIPDDKLDWKPAPSANSALEIVNHLGGGLSAMRSVVCGGEYTPDFQPATDRESAVALLKHQSSLLARVIRELPPHEMEQTVHLPWGEYSKPLALSMDVTDVIHHHGQIAYIQTLLGDTESHFKDLGT
jgi:uncharacterized damage-inducible protein DinB